jgi:chemotaxis protein MotC
MRSLSLALGLALVSPAPLRAASDHHAAPEPPAEAQTESQPQPGMRPLPELTAEQAAQQPFGLVRTLQSIQDQIAQGSASAHALQRKYLVRLNEELRQVATDVWDDPRNARAAVVFVLSGGDPRLVNDLLSRSTPAPIDERLLKAALAFGEGRADDAIEFFEAVDVRSIDAGMAGIVALIHATLVSKKNAKKAIQLFDEARLLAPGTLVEESALRQEILVVAREGDMARFDRLSSQYARRFGKSIYAANFRRQFFAGVARQDFKGSSEWISRTESELQKLAPAERGGAYLSIAEEATLGGNVVIARFAAASAAKLAAPGSVERERAKLLEGAALVLTEDLEKGVAALKDVAEDKLRASDREIREAALAVAGRIRTWPEPPAESAEPPPATVARAQEFISHVDALLGGDIE